jgi:hypothetical protein
MAKMDRTGIAWGVLLGITVTGMYEGFVSLFHDQPEDAFINIIAAVLILCIFMVLTRKVLFPEAYAKK